MSGRDVDRTPKPCLHPQARHTHGTRLAYVLDGCRCVPCKDANRAYEKGRQRLHLYGRGTPTGLVDAEPVRAHLRALMAAGLGWKRIAGMAGVAPSNVTHVLYGRHRVDARKPHQEPPARRLRPQLAEALLAVPLPGVADLGGTVNVDGTGTRRRLQALVALGWSQNRLAAFLGMGPGNFGRTIRSDRVQARHAVAVRELYDRLALTAPTWGSNYERVGIDRVRAHARAQGWPPPLAWDDDSLDDPAARPISERAARGDEGRAFDEVAVEMAMRGEVVRLYPDERAAAVRRLAARGMSDALIAERLHMSQRQAQRLSVEDAEASA